MNQKQKSSTFNNGQCAHFSLNRQAKVVNIRITPIIPTPNLLNFQIFPTPSHFIQSLNYSLPSSTYIHNSISRLAVHEGNTGSSPTKGIGAYLYFYKKTTILLEPQFSQLFPNLNLTLS